MRLFTRNWLANDAEWRSVSASMYALQTAGALAEFERQLIQERTQVGLRVARAPGRFGGRPKALQADKRQLAAQLYQERKIAVKAICELMGISKPTLYAYVRQEQEARERVTHSAPKSGPENGPIYTWPPLFSDSPGFLRTFRFGLFSCGGGAGRDDWRSIIPTY